MERRLSVTQVAAFWNCSRKHVYNLVERGALPAIRIGDLIRFRAEDIEAYENREKPKEAVMPAVSTPKELGTKSPGYLAGLQVAKQRRVSGGR